MKSRMSIRAVVFFYVVFFYVKDTRPVASVGLDRELADFVLYHFVLGYGYGLLLLTPVQV